MKITFQNTKITFQNTAYSLMLFLPPPPPLASLELQARDQQPESHRSGSVLPFGDTCHMVAQNSSVLLLKFVEVGGRGQPPETELLY